MDFAVSGIYFSSNYSLLVVALVATISCIVLSTVLVLCKARLSRRSAVESKFSGTCDYLVGGSEIGRGREMTAVVSGVGVDVGSTENGGDIVMERQTGASMMEQLVPEITTHALSYLDYPSLCRLSMTNSLMRKAANDDNAWKALYHKDFSLEQDNLIPINGWKAYYAATRAVVNINTEFFRIIKERSLQAMGEFWLDADYVKCVHANGESCSGYVPVMESWQLAFNWQIPDLQIREVRTRVLTDMAWVTMKAHINMDNNQYYNMTNVFEQQNGRWRMVHHHSSLVLRHGGAEQQQLLLG